MKEDHRIFDATQFCSCERKPENIQACTGFEPLTSAILVLLGAALYQLGSQASWEQVVELVNNPESS